MFVAVNSRQILSQVGCFGERVTASLFGGEIVSGTCDPSNLNMDVTTQDTLFQVKMCNGRHAVRILPRQIEHLAQVVANPFVYTHGYYVLMFYRGIMGGRNGKSRLMSRRLSHYDRWEILAQEMQRIYVVDVRILNHLINSDIPQMLREGTIVESEGKQGRNVTLYINRSFFLRDETLKMVLTKVFGKLGWRIVTQSITVPIIGSLKVNEVRMPVTFIGHKNHIGKVISLSACKHPIEIRRNEESCLS